ncbi:hypothetical protein Tco_0704606 [Tanacetum coccineum]|uniref:Uncharacterized protein n=1 Tax=Tanacetum coccineum TaxID=301880 RepID=A0ABQ4Y339_9ASTR
MVEDVDNYHLKELRCSTQCHTQKTLWIIKLRDDQKCMKKFKPSSRSKATEDIISIGSFLEVLILNHYVLVRKILGKLSKLQDEDA